jgi:peptide/nickel transport system ATP-binding protein
MAETARSDPTWEIAAPLLAADRLSKTFQHKRVRRSGSGETHAVRDVSFTLVHGGSLGIVGESGSGKTTLARLLVGLEQPTSGRILHEGRELGWALPARERRKRGRLMQIVFQDPYTSLDPRQTVDRVLDEVQRVHFNRARGDRERRSRELLEAVGLTEKESRSLPRDLSGGQRQRVAIARALTAEPSVLVLDEPVSALDVSIQSQILNLLIDLRASFGLSYIFISHDLAVIRQAADAVLVMYRGRVVESGSVERILDHPTHPYTERLLEAVPRPGMQLGRTRSSETHALAPEGCLYRHRCPHAHDRCATEPGLLTVETGHLARCWLVDSSAEGTPHP